MLISRNSDMSGESIVVSARNDGFFRDFADDAITQAVIDKVDKQIFDAQGQLLSRPFDKNLRSTLSRLQELKSGLVKGQKFDEAILGGLKETANSWGEQIARDLFDDYDIINKDGVR